MSAAGPDDGGAPGAGSVPPAAGGKMTPDVENCALAGLAAASAQTRMPDRICRGGIGSVRSAGEKRPRLRQRLGPRGGAPDRFADRAKSCPPVVEGPHIYGASS